MDDPNLWNSAELAASVRLFVLFFQMLVLVREIESSVWKSLQISRDFARTAKILDNVNDFDKQYADALFTLKLGKDEQDQVALIQLL